MEDTTAYDNLFPYETQNGQSGQAHWIHYAINFGSLAVAIVGILATILAVVVLLRSRLWLKHEGYVYLASNFCANIGIFLFNTSFFWLTSDPEWMHYYPPNTSNFLCKLWAFIASIFFYASGWLSVALLFNVYLREDLTYKRCCGCPIFAAKYCTLFATKIIVGIILSLLFVLGLPNLVFFELHPEGICFVSYLVEKNLWNFIKAAAVEFIMMWALPIVVFLPIITLMTLCTKKEGVGVGISQNWERSVSNEQMRVASVTLSTWTFFSQIVLQYLRFNNRFTAAASAPNGYFVLLQGLFIAIQPIFCFVILKDLRDGFCSQLRSTGCCSRLFPSLYRREEEVVPLTAI